MTVFDPAIPADVRKLLGQDEMLLYPASQPLPDKPAWGGRKSADAWVALLQGAAWGSLPAFMGRVYGRASLILGIVAQAGLLAVLIRFGLFWFWVYWIGTTLLAALILVALCGESPARKVARKLHGRYYLPEDFDATGTRMLKRARDAVQAVLESQVNGAGLLDDVANAITLPQQEWEIAQTLREITRLRGEQETVRQGDVTPRIATMLKAQDQALKVAEDSLNERIDALEGYALRTMEADQAYIEWRTLQSLAADSDDYTELLARTVRDKLATDEIDDLTDKARVVEAALRKSVNEARRAGLVLVPDAAQKAS